MTSAPRLEAYLASLDKSLGPIAVSERAEIITEIKSHVLEAQHRDGSLTLDAILDSLGEPEQVANKYLLERGLRPGKPAKRPVFKWLVIGFVGTLVLIFAFISLIVLRVSPLIKVDDAGERVILLGGFIDVNNRAGSVKIGGAEVSGGSKTIKGSTPFNKPPGTVIKIPFTHGDFELLNSNNGQLSWECKVDEEAPEKALVTEEKGEVRLSLDGLKGAKCEIRVPAKSTVDMAGTNAKLRVEKPAFNLTLKGQSGKVSIVPDPHRAYTFDVKVNNGRVGDFTSSKEKDALKINLSLVNGVISAD